MDFLTRVLMFKKGKVDDFTLLSELNTVNTLFEYINSMFSFENVPDTVCTDLLLYGGMINGYYAGFEEAGKLYVLPCSFNGEPDINGIYNDVLINAFNGKSFNRVNEENCVVGYISKTRKRNYDLYYFTKLLSDIDVSFNLNTFFSRNKTIPYARNSTESNKIDEAFKAIDSGQIKTVLLDSNISDLVEGSTMLGTLELTKPEMMKYLPELNKTYDDIFSRFLCKYGCSTNYAGKMAQMTEDELSGYEQFSRVFPNQMLEALQDFCERFNSMFNQSMTVDFSDAFQHLKSDSFVDETVEEQPIEESQTEEPKQEEGGEDAKDE